MKWSCPEGLGRPLTVKSQSMTPVTVKGIDFTGSTSTFSTAVGVPDTCTDPECKHGGAISFEDTVVTTSVTLNVLKCNFSSNSIEFDGGGIYFKSGGKLRLQDVWLQGNEARRGGCAVFCVS